ncbi:hypothetical protein GJAV_G00266470 [Gymnothorax javanicus]|nr:hypothetical protein GJAV_G00266470 [Gymnothorax javanicus]
MESEDRMFSRTSEVDVDAEKWLSGVNYTCKVTQKEKSENFSASICTTLPISPPSVHLEQVPSDGDFMATCEVFTAYKSEVNWILGENEPEVSKNYTEKKDSSNRIQSFVHSLTLPKDRWKSGTSITCEVEHKCFAPVKKHMNLTAYQTTFPSMSLYHRLGSDPAKAVNVTLVCLLSGFYPKEISVEWKEDKDSLQVSPTVQNMESEDRKFTQTSEVDVAIDKWLSGSEYTCKVTQKTQSKELSVSICTSYPVSPPSVHLKSGSSDGDFTAICEVFTAYKSKVNWILGESEPEVSKNYKAKNDSSNRIQSFVHSLTLPKDKWKSRTSITCEVEHKCFAPVKKRMDLTGETSVELYLQQGPQKPGKEVQKLLCSVSGFNPRVTWRVDSVETPAAANRTMTENDGHTVITSEIEVSKVEWIKGVSITCVAADQGLVKPVLKSISICTVTPPSTQSAELVLIGPPLESVQEQEELPFICLLIGFDTSYFTITWKVNGMHLNNSAKTEQPSQNANGTETVRSTLNVKRSEWQAGSQIICEAKHLCSDRSVQKELVRVKDPKPPAVKIIAPSDSELAKSGNASLLCVVSGYTPSQAGVHWELDGKQLPESQYSSSSPLRMSVGGGYVVHSWLQVPGREEGQYSCVVRHESSETPLKDSIANVFAPVTPSPPHATLLQCSGGLICLVHGFSPAAINITWVRNGGVEELQSNTSAVSRGADGKFIIWSLLQVSWEPGVMYTCRVDHVTKTLRLSKSQSEISSDNEYFNENTLDPSSVDSPEEIWNTVYAFLIIFLVTLLYSIVVTLVLMK